MSEVQVKIVHSLYHEVFEKDLAAALTEGWQIADIKTIPVEGADFTVHSLLAILRRGGNEPVRGQGWMLGAIEGLQVQVAQLKADLQAINHALDVNLEGTVRDLVERIDLMMDGIDDDTAEAVPVGFIDLESIRNGNYIDPRSERERLIDAEIARDLAGVG